MMTNSNNGKIGKLIEMRKRLILLLTSVFAVANLIAGNSDWTDRPHTGKPLVYWTFSKDRVNWEDVTVPHSYNNMDGQSKSYYRGEAYYHISLPSSSCKGARYLVFDGVVQSAHVIADGDTLCYHSGAYTPFYVDITGKDCRQIEVAEATKTEEPTGVVWEFNVKMGTGPTVFKAVSPNGTSDEIEILPLQD